MAEKLASSTEEYVQSFPYAYAPASGEDGLIQIGDDVIARIVEIATGEVEGVSLESKFALADLINLKDKEAVKGISVHRNEEDGSVQIVVSVRMGYGRDMYDLALRLRRHVKDTVEKMTHVLVRRVDVRIVGIIVEKKAASEAAAPEA
ncbi:MAG: Asp23/Gls24 family envelope stress response protein [Candidatus Sumerlaeia bacterium]|nr:Asp23/Gls24 family envelope stress response protein [Candidatus Sumerlaeia bacterium]